MPNSTKPTALLGEPLWKYTSYHWLQKQDPFEIHINPHPTVNLSAEKAPTAKHQSMCMSLPTMLMDKACWNFFNHNPNTLAITCGQVITDSIHINDMNHACNVPALIYMPPTRCEQVSLSPMVSIFCITMKELVHKNWLALFLEFQLFLTRNHRYSSWNFW